MPLDQTPFALSADTVRVQLKDLSQKIQTTVQPIFVSHKIEQDLKLREAKPPVVNQQCLVYKSFRFFTISLFFLGEKP